ncbi:hypothetical protein [Cupriavidus sp. EM10]|uniref:hypothetical protein n=1 Tax=Cupriavidus sp. EM10 TaxID=2839983 RepID=UPI001CEC98A9|nr:hypothetical protein [Cupriavidus sp. EM10]
MPGTTLRSRVRDGGSGGMPAMSSVSSRPIDASCLPVPASTCGRGDGHFAGSSTLKVVRSSVLVIRRTLAKGAPDGTR